MWSSSSPANTSGTSGLALALLLSSLFHALAIVFPSFDETSYRKDAIASWAPVRTMALSVTLNHPAAGARAVSVTSKVPRTKLDPSRGADGLSAKISNELSPAMTPSVRQNLLPLPGVDYYATNELTIKPQPLGEAALDPAEIAAIVASGKILLVLRINEQGEVVGVSVDHSDLPDVFSEAVTTAFRKLHFSPGELNGQKVGAVMRVEVRYDDARVPAEP